MPLPNFLIIGAAKAGTTSLWHYCGEHPQVFMSRVKECNFFSGRAAMPGPAGECSCARRPGARLTCVNAFVSCTARTS